MARPGAWPSVAAVLLWALLAGSVGAAQADETASSPDRIAVLAADEAFFRASVGDKGKAWRDFAADDVVLPNAAGRDAVGAAFDKAYARPGFSLAWHPDYAHVAADIAVTSGRFERHILDDQHHDQRTTGRYLTVWHRQKDGAWRFVWDGGTDDP